MMALDRYFTFASLILYETEPCGAYIVMISLTFLAL